MPIIPGALGARMRKFIAQARNCCSHRRLQERHAGIDGVEPPEPHGIPIAVLDRLQDIANGCGEHGFSALQVLRNIVKQRLTVGEAPPERLHEILVAFTPRHLCGGLGVCRKRVGSSNP